MRLATHNSGTGENPYNFFARWFPFIAKCQDKTIEEQCEAGVILFDLRVRFDKNGLLRVRHGLATYDMTLGKAIDIIDKKAKPLSVVMVTYEGEIDGEHAETFANAVRLLFMTKYNVRLGNISVKKPKWTTLYASDYQPFYEQNYVKVVGRKVLWPFPRFWKWLTKKDLEVKDDDAISMEDFV